MATDRIGIGHRTGELAGAIMLSGTKRKAEELGEHALSAVIGDLGARIVSAAVGRYEAHASVDDQLARLRTLLIMVHSAVEAAEGVHIRSWWLRRWIWTLRDAALEETDAASKQAAGNMVWRALRSAKSLLFWRDDSGIGRLSRMVARLEREAMGLGDFLKMLELQIRRPPPVQSTQPVALPPLTLLESDRTDGTLVAFDDRDEVVPLKFSDFGRKRKLEELGGHVLSAAVSDAVARTMSAAVGRYEARASVHEQLERLGMLLVMVHSAVGEAERVHIACWWLRRWLWRLRDAALEGDEVLRLFRSREQRQRAAEEAGAGAASRHQHAAAGAGNTLWNIATRALRRSARSLLLFSRDDPATQRLRRALAALEREAMGLGDLRKLLGLEIRTGQNSGTLDMVISLSCMSREEEGHVAGTTNMGLLIVRQQQHIRRVLGSLAALILRAAGRLIRKPPAPPPPASRGMIPDADELHDLVARIQRAVHATRHAELRGKRNWLDKWRGELQAVASRAERVLLTLPVKAGPDGTDFVDDVGEEDGA